MSTNGEDSSPRQAALSSVVEQERIVRHLRDETFFVFREEATTLLCCVDYKLWSVETYRQYVIHVLRRRNGTVDASTVPGPMDEDVTALRRMQPCFISAIDVEEVRRLEAEVNAIFHRLHVLEEKLRDLLSP